MRRNALVVAVLALVVAGSASAAPSGKSNLIHVVKHSGAYTATVAYSRAPGRYFAVGHMTLRVQRDGHPVLQHRICPHDFAAHERCTWTAVAWYPQKPARLPLGFRDVAGPGTPVVALDLYTGYAHCCVDSFIALLGHRPRWIVHDWGSVGYHSSRVDGRYYFVSGDNRFAYAFTSYAGSAFPVQIWAIDKRDQLVEVTRSLPSRIRADARRAWNGYLLARRDRVERGLGVLAAWCADEYLLDDGAKCQRELGVALAAEGYLHAESDTGGRAYIRKLNHDLERWGYKR